MNLEKARKIFKDLKSISDNFLLAGSARREKPDNLHDLDVIYLGDNIPNIPNEMILANGDELKRIKLNGEQIDIHKCSKDKLGSMLLYFTGSKSFGIKLRYIAKKKGLKLNRWGLFDGNKCIASETEREIFDLLEVEWKEPKDRDLGDHVIYEENDNIVKAFKHLGIYCTMKNDYFRSRAYNTAAEILSGLENIRELIVNDELLNIDGIGKSISIKIEEFLDTGKIKKLTEYMKEIPEEILELTELDGIGPKKAFNIFKELNVKNKKELKKACQNKELSKIKGFGIKTEDKILIQLND